MLSRASPDGRGGGRVHFARWIGPSGDPRGTPSAIATCGGDALIGTSPTTVVHVAPVW